MIKETRLNARGRRLCDAKQDTCGGLAMRGKTKCKNHGGKSPDGMASPHYKHGLRSKYLTAIPERMKANFKELCKRQDLLELNNEIALVDSRLLDILGRVDSGESGALWLKLQKALTAFHDASDRVRLYQGEAQSKAKADMRAALEDIEQLIERGVADVFAWKELYGLLEQRRKLVESERKRIVEQQEVLTSREAFALFTALAAVVNEHITDPDTRATVHTQLLRVADPVYSKHLRAVG